MVNIVVAIGFLCSLSVIVPVGVLLRMDKSSESYRILWSWVVVIMAAICFATFAYILTWPYYSQTPRQTMNPSGPSGSPFLGILFWVVAATVVLPSFPALLLLSLFPPQSQSPRKRRFLAAILVVFVIVAAALALLKYRAYSADYQIERAKPQQTPFERFKYLRASQGRAANGAD